MTHQFSKKEYLKNLQVGWITGVVYFFVSMLEFGIDMYSLEVSFTTFFGIFYTIIKVVVTVAFGLFMWGFVGLGSRVQSPLLQISAWLMVGVMVIVAGYDIFSIYQDYSIDEMMIDKGTQGVLLGGVNIVFGIALFRLASVLGNKANYAGTLEIVAGVAFITIFLAPLGLFLLIPANILEIVILYTAMAESKKGMNMVS